MKTNHGRQILYLLLLIVFSAFAAPRLASAATYYVSPAGSDSNPGTSGNPWQTLSYATSKMSGGDTLILKDGTYYGRKNKLLPPSGSPGNYTVIKAESDWKAVIDGNDELTEWEFPVYAYNKSYIRIEGLKVTNGAPAGAVVVHNSDHIKLLRLSLWNAVQPESWEATPLQVRGHSSDVLAEDIWITGTMRYGASIYRQPSDGVGPQRVILRRVVVRWDYSQSGWPKAGITVYGVVDGTMSDIPKDILLQNNIVIDTNPSENHCQNWGGYLLRGSMDNVTLQGNIALNLHGYSGNKCTGEGWMSGFNLSDGSNTTGNVTLVDNIAWDLSGASVFIPGGGNNTKEILIDRLSSGSNDADGYVGLHKGIEEWWNRTNVTVKNSLFYQNDNINDYKPGTGSTYTETFNCYYPSTIEPTNATNAITTDPGIKYITRVEDTSPCYGSGGSGSNRGATLLYRYGADNAGWGESGYNTLSAKSLWPWPNEDQIKKDFSTPNNPPAASLPNTNDPKRGFCADGKALYGGQVTLTSYIWEYLGNPCPLSICNYVKPSPPPSPVVY